MQNRAFWRATHSLAHPISLIAILALLLNDHFLRIQSPSWLTGKLGDFAWLVFAPFICAAAIAWLIRGHRQEKIVGMVAFGFIGAWFALAKTTPLVHGWTVNALEMVVGYRGTLRIDPTDLITLPALLIGWQVWQRAQNTSQTLKPRAWVLLAFGTVTTLANSAPMFNYGISTLCQDAGNIYASTVWADAFMSDDGGITWDPINSARLSFLSDCNYPVSFNYSPTPSSFEIELGEGRTLLFIPGQSIKRSDDNGETWIVEFDLRELDSEVRDFYYEHVAEGGNAYFAGPLEAVVDTQTGNIIAAMGHEGLLVRTPDGLWQWVAVGDYQHRDLYQRTITVSLLSHQIFIAIILAALIPSTIGRALREPSIIVQVGLILAWTFWILLSTAFAPDPNKFPIIAGEIIRVFMAWLTLIIAFILLVKDLSEIFSRERRALIDLTVIIGYTLVAFFIPHILWARETIPSHVLASTLATLSTLVILLGSAFYLRRQYPILFKVKRKLAQRLAAGEIVFEDDHLDDSDD